MVSFYVLATSLLLLRCAGADPVPTEIFPHNVILDMNSMVKMYWKYNDTHITFEVHGHTTGWVGIGFSPNGGMIGADIYIGWVKDGRAFITVWYDSQDRHGQDSNTYPPKDPEQNVDLLAGFECDGWTVIKFQRQIPACEVDFDQPITGDTTKAIYAFGLTDPTGDDVMAPDDYHHSNRGTKNVILFDIPNLSESMYPDGEEETHLTGDLTNDEFHLPAVKSHYNCRILALPSTGEKLHLVKIEPLLQPGNELYLHHILLYQCSGSYAVPPDQHINSNSECYTSNMPPDSSENCIKVIAAWAVGGGAFYFPKHTGLVFGVEGTPRYVIMETHYDNPNSVSGVVDSSGLRLTYTSRLRQHDSGVLEIGHTVDGTLHLIPPNADSFLDYGSCTVGCLNGAFDQAGIDEINVYGILQHSHLAGRGITTRHFRNGVELPPLASDKSYDFNYQESRTLSSERVIQRGDAVQAVCNYNTKDRTEFTYGGLETTKEMCMTFIYYYPAMPISFCQSAWEYNALMNYFGLTEISIIGEHEGVYTDLTSYAIVKPENLAGQTVAEYLNSMPWDQEMAENFSIAARDLLKSQNCFGDAGWPDGLTYRTFGIEINETFTPPEENCNEPTQGATSGEITDSCVIATTLPPPVTTTIPTLDTTTEPPVDTTTQPPSSEPDPTESFPHNVVLDIEGKIKIYWKYNETHITFEMHGQTNGWLGIGFSPNGGMIGADIYIGWVKEGTAYITDRHGQDSNTYPPKDPEQNVDLLAGFECDGWTVIKFQRQIPACEVDFDRAITGDTTKVIYAFGITDPEGDDIKAPDDYHGTNRGSKSVILIDIPNGDESMFPEGETHITLDLKADNFHLPAVPSYYNCRMFEIPTDRKYHLVMAEPILHPGNEQHLHHIVAYFCTQLKATEHVGDSAECYSPNMADFAGCTEVLAAWAVGGGPIVFPKHTGLVFGDTSSSKYVLLEIHYDNPTSKAGVIDSSGLRLIYTPDLRLYDSGTLIAGQSTSGIMHIIPPNAQSFLTTATCTSTCLSAGMNAIGVDQINVYGVMLHSHLTGRALKLKHIRDKVELPPLAKDDFYDFNYQETRMMPTEKVVKNGDALQAICNYHTKGKSEVTLGGLQTTSEMCEAFIYYYPRLPTYFCITSPVMNQVFKYFGIDETDYTWSNYSIYDTIYNVHIVKPDELAGVNVADHINAIDWTEAKVKDFEKATHDMVHQQYCASTTALPDAVPTLHMEVQIDVPYADVAANCSEPRTGATSGDELDVCTVTTTLHTETTTVNMATTPATGVNDEMTTAIMATTPAMGVNDEMTTAAATYVQSSILSIILCIAALVNVQ